VRHFDNISKALAKSMGLPVEDFSAGFKPAAESDVAALVAFWERNLGAEQSFNLEKYLRWRYSFLDDDSGNISDNMTGNVTEENSSKRDAANRNNKLWTMTFNGQIMGMLGAQSMPLAVGDRQLEAIHTMDMLVDKSIDGGGLGAWMPLALNHHHDIMVLIGSNKNSSGLVRRIFQPMPNRRQWKMALNLTRLIEKVGLSRRLAQGIAALSNPLAGAMRNRRVKKYLRPEFTLKNLTTFPDSVAAISHSHQNEFIYRPRSAAFLNWKFTENPNKTYQLLGVYCSDTLVAYAVFHTSDANANANANASGGKVNADAVIDDFFWLKHDDANKGCSPETLLAMVVQHLQREGFGLIKVASYGVRCQQAMEQLGFIQREEHLLFSLSCNLPDAEHDLFNPDHWFITDADAHGLAC